MLVCKEFKFCYLRPPRTATQSITWNLSSRYDVQYPVSTDNSGHRTVWSPEFSGFFTFIVVRNPFPRLVSSWRRSQESPYRDRKRPAQSFREYVEDIDRGWREWACHSYTKAPLINRVVRYENLAEDLALLPCEYFPKKIELVEHKGKSKYPKPWWEEYDEETVKAVQKAWAVDFRVYGYSLKLEDAIS